MCVSVCACARVNVGNECSLIEERFGGERSTDRDVSLRILQVEERLRE